MKVKNIAFSGFAAVILAGVCGVANAASVNLASKSYVDTALESKADLIDLEDLRTTVGQKATQESLEKVATQVNTNTANIATLMGKEYLTNDDLTALRTALETEIAKKQDSGDYVTAEALQTVSTELATLKGSVYTKDEIDKKITDAISGGQIDLSGYATTSALDALTLLVNGNTTEINALKNAGYQTSSQVQGAITTAVADLATEQALSNLQTTLEAAIDEKQAKGEYLTAESLTTLNEAITALQTGKADATTVETIQTTINNLGNTYASKSDMTAADAELRAAIEAINVPSLEGYVKSSELAPVAKSGSYADLTDKPEIPSIDGLATEQALTNLQTTLEAAIAEKQEKGDYADAADLATLNDAVSALQTGKADASTVETIQTTINNLGNTYASKSDMTAADAELRAAIEAINVPSLEGYVKSSELAPVAKSGSYADLTDKPEIPSIDGLATEQALTNLQTTLEAAIAEKQDAGEYLVAADLTTLNDAITALQTGKADKSTVETIQTTINNLGNTYASKSDLTAAEEKLQAAIDGMDLSAYAKVADVYTKAQADAKFLVMQDANALGANLQWDEDGKLNTKGIATAEGLEELESKVASAVTESELESKGYQTATNVADAIAAAVADKQDKLTAGTNIEIVDNTISATIDTSSLVKNPTLPTDDGNYMLMVESNGGAYTYTWTNIEDYVPSEDYGGNYGDLM